MFKGTQAAVKPLKDAVADIVEEVRKAGLQRPVPEWVRPDIFNFHLEVSVQLKPRSHQWQLTLCMQGSTHDSTSAKHYP